MRKKNIYVLGVGVLLTLAVVSAYWLISYKPVIYCDDTDNGLNFWSKGTIFFINVNGTNETYTDFCYSNSEVREFACSDDVPPNPPGYAGYFGENCTSMNATCFDGRCIPDYNFTRA